MSNKNIEIHHRGAVGHLSSRGRKVPTDPIHRHRTGLIINGFTILEMSRVHSGRIYRGVKTKTRLPPPMVGRDLPISDFFCPRLSCPPFLPRRIIDSLRIVVFALSVYTRPLEPRGPGRSVNARTTLSYIPGRLRSGIYVSITRELCSPRRRRRR